MFCAYLCLTNHCNTSAKLNRYQEFSKPTPMEHFRKLTFLEKTWLKYTNRTAYQTYKSDLAKQEDNTEALFLQQMHDFNRLTRNFADLKNPPYTFKHSGNLGDVIYALPTIQHASQGQASTLYLHLNQPSVYTFDHPLGGVMLNEKILEMFVPLFEAQPYISHVKPYAGEEIDADFDLMRKLPIPLDRGDIARWYAYIFNVYPDLAQPCLHVSPDTSYADCMVLARSQRYNNPHIDYSFLKQYKNLVFVGVEQEYALMKAVIPHLAYTPVKDFLALARLIKGAKLFIGNQSFPFAIAEALKVPRLLEAYHACPNVIVHGANGYDFHFQTPFETLVKKLY